MKIIKLDATESTNSYIKNSLAKKSMTDFTVVQALSQLKGRGQMGTNWESQAGKNLTFSVLKKFDRFCITDQFMLNITSSLAVLNTLRRLQVPDLSVKWPNDILSGHAKICGILIENMLKGQTIQHAIIGIGLNVNQIEFAGLPQATSIKSRLGHTLNLDELLSQILNELQKYLTILQVNDGKSLKAEYESYLFKKDKPATFKGSDDQIFMGYIRGVSDLGKLVVCLEDKHLKEFDLKEIQLLH